LQGVTLGGGRGGGFDRTAVQNAMNDFTACLRTNGVQVDDITFGPRGGANGANGGNGGATTGSTPADGNGPGFGGPPPNGSAPTNGNGGPGGAGFDPTARLIQRLGLDATNPAVKAALDTCTPIMTKAFQPTTTTTTP
jgi:hypothetical protein